MQQTPFKMVNRKEQNELYCLGTLKDCWSHRFWFSLSFHAGLSPINNLCNILSQSVRSDSLMATGIQITVALKLFLWLYSLAYAFSLSE